MKNKNFLIYGVFLFITYSAFSIDGNISSVYLTDELKFSKESLSFVKMISAPANIVCSILSGYMSGEKPFTCMRYITLVMIGMCCYNIFVLLGNFPKKPEDQQSFWNLVHVGTTVLVKELIDNFWFTTSFAVITKIVDKRVAGIHITLLASITNLSQFSHKFYIFSLVQKFGIFYP